MRRWKWCYNQERRSDFGRRENKPRGSVAAKPPFATGSSQKSFIVPALGDTEFDMMITANMALGLLKLANSMDKQSDEIGYGLSGVVTIDLPFVGDVPFHQDGSFSLGSKQ